MKTKIITTILLIVILFKVSLGQGILNLNYFKYLYVAPLTYENGGNDIYKVREIVIDKISKCGIKVIDENYISDDIKENKCIVVSCYISHTNILGYKDPVIVKFVDCKNKIVYQTQGVCGIVFTVKQEFEQAARSACEPFDSYTHVYKEPVFPELEKTNETEETLKKYFTENKIEPIEGIYKSYQSDQLSYYKLGIIKQNDKYKAIIIESDLKQWKTGEVKAYFEQSSMKGLFATKWLMGNKTSYETFSSIENDAILTIELKDANTGEKRQEKFIKMFPTVSESSTFKKDNQIASGSGFFISSTGVIATNAHVITDASKIVIVVSNEIGTFTYKTKVLLSDNKNDVALLQIDDSTFKGLSSIPYGLSEKGEVGEKVFTIGYPLNDVMGTNYKLTDGIISSKSGIEDDIRYYQISVPLQPGNSGGPLFNKDGIVIGITSSKLNSKAVGTELQNVNYAIKATYLLNLYNMLPNPAKIETTSQVANKQLQDQVKVLKNYVCLIKIY